MACISTGPFPLSPLSRGGGRPLASSKESMDLLMVLVSTLRVTIQMVPPPPGPRHQGFWHNSGPSCKAWPVPTSNTPVQWHCPSAKQSRACAPSSRQELCADTPAAFPGHTLCSVHGCWRGPARSPGTCISPGGLAAAAATCALSILSLFCTPLSSRGTARLPLCAGHQLHALLSPPH